MATHRVTSLTLKEVKTLLPPDHCFRVVKNNSKKGVQDAKNYFVASLQKHYKKYTVNDVDRTRLITNQVLEDGSISEQNQDCILYGKFSVELDKSLSQYQGPTGIWPAVERQREKVWLVFQRPIVQDYQGRYEDWHRYTLTMDPEDSPDSSLWVLVQEQTASTSESNSTSTSFTLKEKLRDAHAPPPPQPVTGAAMAQKSPLQHKRKSNNLQPLSKGTPGSKLTVLVVVVEVVKDGHISKGNTVYDVLKVTDKSCTEPGAPQTHYLIKIFHNNDVHWQENGRPKVGTALLIKEMKFDEYRGTIGGTVYNTSAVTIFSTLSDGRIVWHSQTKKKSSDFSIGHKDFAVQMLLKWWREEGCTLDFGRLRDDVTTKAAAELSTVTLSEAGGKGAFKLYCKVLAKTIYLDLRNPKTVLRVTDGSQTIYRFEQIKANPKTIKEDERDFGLIGDTEVDVVLSHPFIPPVVDKLKEGSFVCLNGVECLLLDEQRRRMTLLVDNDSIQTLADDDPHLHQLRRGEMTSEDPTPKRRKLDFSSCPSTSRELSRVPSPQTSAFRETSRSPSPQSSTLQQSSETPSQPSTSWQLSEAPSLQPPTSHQSDNVLSLQSSTPWQLSRAPSPQPFTPPKKTHSAHSHTHKELTVTIKNTKDPNRFIQSSVKELETRNPTPDLPQSLHTEIQGEKKTATLQSFLLEGEADKIYCVKASITDIKIITDAEGQHCKCEKKCLHQWVWGLCSVCKTIYSSFYLYNHQNREELLNDKLLKCIECNHKKLHEEDRIMELSPLDVPQPSVHPFINLKILVEEPFSSFRVPLTLSADYAHQLFGVEPKFSWLLTGEIMKKEDEQKVEKIVELLLLRENLLNLGMMKKGSSEILLVNTVFNY